jgi:multidrug efflux pump subunit AcrB
MWISDTSIKRPVFATMVIVSFMVLGIVSLGRLGIDLFPEVNLPFVNIFVVYPGAGPEEVETLVTRPIEDAVAGINGVKRVISTSSEGFSRVGIELRLESIRRPRPRKRRRLPRSADAAAGHRDPTIQRLDVAALPIMLFAVGSSQPSDARRQVEDDPPLLEQIDGSRHEVNGGEVR